MIYRSSVTQSTLTHLAASINPFQKSWEVLQQWLQHCNTATVIHQLNKLFFSSSASLFTVTVSWCGAAPPVQPTRLPLLLEVARSASHRSPSSGPWSSAARCSGRRHPNSTAGSGDFYPAWPGRKCVWSQRFRPDRCSCRWRGRATAGWDLGRCDLCSRCPVPHPGELLEGEGTFRRPASILGLLVALFMPT